MKDKREVFKKYPNPIFVETGSYNGDGIAYALKYGFERIISIELHEQWYKICLEKYTNNKKVELYHGDSEVLLSGILTTVHQPCTFWLDAHYSGEGTGDGIHSVPILEELETIRYHSHYKNVTHTLLIDDLRYFRKGWHGVKLDDVIDRIKQINPSYNILFEDSFMNGKVLPEDILAAYV